MLRSLALSAIAIGYRSSRSTAGQHSMQWVLALLSAAPHFAAQVVRRLGTA